MKNFTHIHADHCASDIFLSEFKQFCHEFGARNIILQLLISQVHQWVECTTSISTDSIFLLVLYKAIIIFILSVIMEAFRSVIMVAFRDQFTATELLSYKAVLYDEATKSGMHSVIWTKWNVKNVTVCI